MKKCPTCSRTYADDGFTFCLEDGALLSAPYENVKEEPPVSTILSGPPPTAVLPRTGRGGHEVPSTVKSLPLASQSNETKPQLGVKPESSVRRSPIKFVVIGLVALTLVVGALGLGLYASGTSNCPRLVINCSPSDTTTYCDLGEDNSPPTSNNVPDKPISEALCSRSVILLQGAALPEGITTISWSASDGTIKSNHSQMTIDTSGLAGKTIEVKANVTTRSWFCSTTVSKSFVVPSGFGSPAK